MHLVYVRLLLVLNNAATSCCPWCFEVIQSIKLGSVNEVKFYLVLVQQKTFIDNLYLLQAFKSFEFKSHSMLWCMHWLAWSNEKLADLTLNLDEYDELLVRKIHSNGTLDYVLVSDLWKECFCNSIYSLIGTANKFGSLQPTYSLFANIY